MLLVIIVSPICCLDWRYLTIDAMRSNVIDTVCFVGWFYQCAVTDTLQTAWRQWQIGQLSPTQYLFAVIVLFAAFSSYVRSESERMVGWFTYSYFEQCSSLNIFGQALDLVGSLADLSQSAVTIRDIVQQCCKGFKAGHLLPDFSSCIETQPTGVTGALLILELAEMGE